MRHFIFNLSASLQDSLFAAGISPGSSWNDAWHAFNQLHCSQVGDFHQQLVKEASPRISDNTPAFSNVLAKRLNRWITIKMTSLGDAGIDQSWSALQRAVERAGQHFHYVALDAVAFIERIVPNSVTLFLTSQLALVRDASRHRALEPADVIDLVNLACKLESNLRQSAGSTRDGSFAGIPTSGSPREEPPNSRDPRTFPRMSKDAYDTAVAKGPPSKSGKGLCPCGVDHWANQCPHRAEHTRLKMLRGDALKSAQAGLS